ncbi:MAG: type I restriction-modification system endonuclease [Verrucomicrobiaceae bacterium]
MPLASPNFQFLKKHDQHLLKLAAGAEAYCFTEPDLALTRVRQLSEAIVASVLKYTPQNASDRPSFLSQINQLLDQGILSRELGDTLHTIRRLANHAVHSGQADQGKALHGIKLIRGVAIWFHKLSQPNFKAGAFVPPPSPVDASDELEKELDALKEELTKEQQARNKAENKASTLAEAHAQAVNDSKQAYDDQLAALELAAESEKKWQESQEAFLSTKTEETKVTSEEAKEVTKTAKKAAKEFASDLDEAETREIIDAQLQDAGWIADTINLRYSRGTRPQRGLNKAIAEWPTSSGPVDYALFIGTELVAVAEAKRFNKDLSPVLGQAKRYAKDIDPKKYTFPEGSPWFEYKAPFAFAGNGRPYHKQLPEKSGILFHDLRLDTNKLKALDGWRSPQGLLDELEIDKVKADQDLSEHPVDLPLLRLYQREAISAIEENIAKGRDAILLAMATGTGKTRTAISLIYRLIQHKRFKRILFLVDRTTLGEQSYDDGFNRIQLEALQTFTDIYNVAQLGDTKIEKETKVHIATVQSMVRRVVLLGDDAPPPVDQYDCVIIDECHRGYVLDKDMDESEIAFRSEADFISKYRRVVDHFHAVKIGLTATPAQHTSDIFGAPVFTYSYREAVTDGYLCDHTPPTRITTALVKHGIKWKKGEKVLTYNPTDASIESHQAPDEVLKGVEAFNTQVITKPFNETISEELAQYLDPETPGKTLVFCATDSHADIFVTALKDALDATYGPQPDSLIAKITGSGMQADKTLLRRFKNEQHPKIAVTVDLLTTGIDVPQITKLIFVRRVKSRILYEQMLGRATRLCENLFGEGEDKEVFEIFDTVDIYAALEPVSTMKPVVTQASAGISELFGFMTEAMAAQDSSATESFHSQLVVKVRRLRKKIDRKSDELATRFSDLTPESLLEALSTSPAAATDLFKTHPTLPQWLETVSRSSTPRSVLVSEHPDRVMETTSGYGEGREKPEDYLERFNLWIEEHKSTHEALKLVLTAPGSLTRKELRSLSLAMDDAGFTEHQIQPAWREVKHEMCAAKLLGYIRAQALGSPLLPYEQRVDAAAQRILAKPDFRWTENQKRWLSRIVNQIKSSTIVDRDSLQAGAYASAGGFDTINKSFSGKLESLLTDLHTEIWQDPAA